MPLQIGSLNMQGLHTSTRKAESKRPKGPQNRTIQGGVQKRSKRPGAGSESKFTSAVRGLAKTQHVTALQEIGSKRAWDEAFGPPTRHNLQGRDVFEYNTNLGTKSRQSNVSMYATFDNGRRVNSAICANTTLLQREGLTAQPMVVAPGFARSRPAPGVNIGGTNYVSIHSLSGSGGGRDLPAQLNALDGLNQPFVAIGDKNRADLARIPQGATAYSSAGPTHVHGGSLDAIIAKGVPVSDVKTVPGGSSDHLPITAKVG